MKRERLIKQTRFMNILIILCMICLLTAACSSPSSVPAGAESKESTATLESITYVIEDVPVIYTSIPEISSKSNAIVIGQPVAIKEVVNTALDNGNPAKPDPDLYSIGQIYEVRVDSYLKGDGGKIIFVIQSQGVLVTKSGPPTIEEIGKAQNQHDHIPLGLNKKYVMFLRSSRRVYEGYPNDDVFFGVGHPWLFDLSDPECIRPEDSLVSIYRYYPPQPLSELIKKIDEPFSPSEAQGAVPYPGPESMYICPDEATSKSTPYP
jgi:hypothetical protein